MTPHTAHPLSRRPALAGVVALVLVAVLALPGATSAAQPTLERVHFRLSDDPEVFDYDDCGEHPPAHDLRHRQRAGLLHRRHLRHARPERRHLRLAHGHFGATSTNTNTVTGQSATLEEGYRYPNSGDAVVEDHPDQIAFFVNDTGTHKLRGPDGTVLWHSAGLTTSFVVRIPGEGIVSAEILVQHGNLADGDFCQVLTTSLGL